MGKPTSNEGRSAEADTKLIFESNGPNDLTSREAARNVEIFLNLVRGLPTTEAALLYDDMMQSKQRRK